MDKSDFKSLLFYITALGADAGNTYAVFLRSQEYVKVELGLLIKSLYPSLGPYSAFSVIPVSLAVYFGFRKFSGIDRALVGRLMGYLHTAGILSWHEPNLAVMPLFAGLADILGTYMKRNRGERDG
jgi:hypothetical protein